MLQNSKQHPPSPHELIAPYMDLVRRIEALPIETRDLHIERPMKQLAQSFQMGKPNIFLYRQIVDHVEELETRLLRIPFLPVPSRSGIGAGDIKVLDVHGCSID